MKLWLSLAIALTLIGTLVALPLIYSSLPDEHRPALLLSVSQTLLQLSLIGIVGWGVKAMYDEIARQRDQRERVRAAQASQRNEANKLRRELCDKFQKACSETIQSLRIDESGWSSDAHTKHRAVVSELNSLRGELEEISYQLESSPGLFAAYDQITAEISSQISYLSGLFDESLRLKASLRELSAEEKARLADESELYKHTPAYAQFVKAREAWLTKTRQEILRLMRQDILGIQPGTQ